MIPINVGDYEELARQALDASAFDYYSGGSDDEVTLRGNRDAYARLRLRPRVLVDVSRCDPQTRVLGTPLRAPVMIAPLGCQGLAHPEGECATARAAAAAGTLMVVSTMATRSLEDVAQAATGPRWFQLYLYRDREISARLIERARSAGYQAVMLTVDAPVLGKRERDLRNGFGLPPHLRFANFDADEGAAAPSRGAGVSSLARHTAETFEAALGWEVVGWLRERTTLPIVLKGILTAEDARLAVQHGVDAIVVSNHGGRQLDTVTPTIEALPEVVEAVAGRCEVYLDGGIRRGTDVLKALALGARAVLVGRPILWGLAAAGEGGVRHVLEILDEELRLAMALAGCPSIDTITRSRVTTGHATS